MVLSSEKKLQNSMYNLIPFKKMYKCTEDSGRLYTSITVLPDGGIIGDFSLN